MRQQIHQSLHVHTLGNLKDNKTPKTVPGGSFMYGKPGVDVQYVILIFVVPTPLPGPGQPILFDVGKYSLHILDRNKTNILGVPQSTKIPPVPLQPGSHINQPPGIIALLIIATVFTTAFSATRIMPQSVASWLEAGDFDKISLLATVIGRCRRFGLPTRTAVGNRSRSETSRPPPQHHSLRQKLERHQYRRVLSSGHSSCVSSEESKLSTSGSIGRNPGSFEGTFFANHLERRERPA